MHELAYMLALVLVIDTGNLLAILDDLLDIGLLEDFDSIRLTLGEILELQVSALQRFNCTLKRQTYLLH
jgi:hypothetical protein